MTHGIRFSLRIATLLVALLIAAPTLAQENHSIQDGSLAKHYFDDDVTEAQLERLNAMIGKSLPADLLADLEWLSGDPKNLGASRSKVVLIQFWSLGSSANRSWLQRVAVSDRKFHDDDLVVVAIHPNGEADDLSKARDFVARQSIPVTTAIDSHGGVTTLFHADERPVNILIDRQGAVRYYGLNGRGVDKAIERLVAEEFDPDAAPPTPFLDPTNPDADGPAAAAENDGFPAFTNSFNNAIDFRGKKAPALEVEEWLTSKPRMNGKVLIVDFWATWCGPCVASIPHMNGLANTFRDEVVVVGLSNENEGTLRGFLRSQKMDYAVATDSQRRMSTAVGVKAIPHVLVISPDGVVRFQGHPAQLTEAIVDQIVRASAATS